MISPVFLPRHFGGAEVWMAGVAQELRRQGNRVSVFTSEIADPVSHRRVAISDDLWEGLPVRRIHYDKAQTGAPPPWYDTLNVAVGNAVGEYLSQTKPDVVHLTCGHRLSASPLIAAKSLRYPVLVTLVDHWYICPITTLLRPAGNLCTGRKTGVECLGCLSQRSRVHRLISRWPQKAVKILTRANATIGGGVALPSLALMRAVDQRNRVLGRALGGADLVLAPSRSLLDAHLSSGIVRRERARFRPHGVDLSYASRGRSKSPATRLRIGFTGHLLPGKGAHLLVQALHFIPNEVPVDLSIWGSLDRDAEYGRELVALAAEDRRIRFRGPFKNQDIGEILQEIDVVAVPSIWVEASPLVVLEALAAQTPVLGARAGGIADLIEHDQNGLLFERGNAFDLARQITRLVNDPGLLAHLAAHSGSVPTVADDAAALVELYREVQARPARS